MPRRRTTVASALVAVALAGGLALAARMLVRRPRRGGMRTYSVLADMGETGFRSVIWTAETEAEARSLAARISPAFGRTWVEGPDGKRLTA